MTAGGRIINIGSINADRAFGPGMTLYVTSKAAVAGFTRALAAELGEQGVTVNCIQPGPVDTDMNPADGEFADFARGFTALGRSPGRRRLRVSRRFWPVCRAATSPAPPSTSMAASARKWIRVFDGGSRRQTMGDGRRTFRNVAGGGLEGALFSHPFPLAPLLPHARSEARSAFACLGGFSELLRRNGGRR